MSYTIHLLFKYLFNICNSTLIHQVKGECGVLSASEILEAVEEAEGGYSRHLEQLMVRLQVRKAEDAILNSRWFS